MAVRNEPAGTGPSGPATLDLLERGATLDRYTVLEKLGAGGMGEVYAAYDRVLDRKVALKVLRHNGNDHAERLKREAQAMAKLSHPNVVAVFDAGTLDNRLFVAMEFVRGVTLRAWRDAGGHDWRQVLGAYIEAGRGLAAAHAEGLVHRDFKPDNVLVSTTGAIKVTDFGIARIAAGDDAERDAAPADDAGQVGSGVFASAPPALGPRSLAPTHGSVLSTPMTEEGALLGTPGYMAPEQYLGEPVDARTDQFAFCTSLYEALYGERPFAAESMTQLLSEMLEDTVRSPPRGARVPARVRRVLLRGLSSERLSRYPSMNALLLELARDPARKWKRVIAVLATGALVVAGASSAQRATAAHRNELCASSTTEAEEVWNADVEQRMGSAMRATGVPYAADTWQRTRGAVSDYMARWTTMHRQTCEATRIEGHQSEQVLNVRMLCLAQRREDVRALTRVLSAADREVMTKAVQAAMALPSLEACRDVTSLMAIEPEPGDPAQHGELESVRKSLAEVRAEFRAGRYAPARDHAAAVTERARVAGYAPLTAEALLWSARAMAASGSPRSDCIDRGAEAAFSADRGRDDATRAEAATSTMHWATQAGRFPEAVTWSKVAEAALLREKQVGARRGDWLKERCYLLYTQRQLELALPVCEEAWEIAKHEDLARVLDVGSLLTDVNAALGHSEEAERIIAASDAALVAALGEEHPARMTLLNNRAYVAGLAWNYGAAAGYAIHAAQLGEKTAPESAGLSVSYINACISVVRNGDAAGALGHCDKALALTRRAYGPESALLAEAHYGRGEALLELHRYDEAIVEYRETVRIYDATGTPSPTVVGALTGTGLAELAKGENRRAVATLEQAVRAVLKFEARTSDELSTVADARFALARALFAAGTKSERLVELCQLAAEGHRRATRTERAREVEQWMFSFAKPKTP